MYGIASILSFSQCIDLLCLSGQAGHVYSKRGAVRGEGDAMDTSVVSTSECRILRARIIWHNSKNPVISKIILDADFQVAYPCSYILYSCKEKNNSCALQYKVGREG